METLETLNIRTGLVIMASGAGRRYGGNKLMADLGGKPLIKWILDSTEGAFDRRVVVTRHKEVKDLCDALNIDCIVHDLPDRNDTVRLGLGALMNDIDYCFFAPGDQPLIRKESIDSLIREAIGNNDKIVRTGFGDNAGSPVGFPKFFFDELLALPQGKGGNLIAGKNPALVHAVQVQDEYELWDVDTVSDLETVKKLLRI